ncbi:phosphorylated adapter RNA export RNA-binding domain-containing protein [Candidatus Chloroploca sp. Khr17]|uniref:phosphorylated adapter RNA export RNA-binding domain-containing protein n=1 Tax=Candidatus Chloroploca sp. Khr17 TaxID=2496869 RepID=UPI00101B9D21|nr:phosphorylated adapter RNA export RNA-binding domain-containing protein [Candidatus Chloroploca sp. Khr17]
MRGSRQRDRRDREEQQRQAEIAQRQAARKVRQTIEHIATTLGETEERQFAQITRVVEVCGVDESMSLLEETLQIEANGGMMTADGIRRRSPGGAYMTLLKKRLKESGRKDDLKRII